MPWKTARNLGEHEREEEDGDGAGHRSDDAGVDRGADDHLAGLDLLSDVVGDAVEHLGEGAGHLRCADHVDVERAEELGVACERLAELLAALHVVLQADDDLLEARVGGLLGDTVECGAEVDAGPHHDGELVGEVEDVLLLGRTRVHLAEALHEVAAVGEAVGGPEREDVCALVAQNGGRAGDRVGREHASENLAVLSLDLVAVLGHFWLLRAKQRQESWKRSDTGEADEGGESGRQVVNLSHAEMAVMRRGDARACRASRRRRWRPRARSCR